MNIRLKFLIVFSISAFTALSFFGYVAYDTAAEQSNRNESESLFQIFDVDIENVSLAVKNNEDIKEAVLKSKHSDNLHFLVFDTNHHLLYIDETLSVLKPEHIERLPFDSMMGTFDVSDVEYHWYTKNVSEKNYTVAALYPVLEKQGKTFFSQMAVTLIITAFIVLWSAAWSAMYIGSLFEKLQLQKKELEKLATHDSLTLLPNRTLFNDRVGQAILRSLRGHEKFAICFMDLNKFKEVNDTLGHQCGDQLLQEVAKRITEKLRKSDTIARLGGDEFALLLINVDREGAEVAVNKIINEIEQPIIMDDKTLSISGSIGIAMYPRHGADADDLLSRADDAMYAAKKSGSHFYHYIDEKDHKPKSDNSPIITPTSTMSEID